MCQQNRKMPLTIYIYGADEKSIVLHAVLLLLVAGIQCHHVFILGNIQKSVFMHREGDVRDVTPYIYIYIYIY